jgi:hypothetical protein
VHHRNYCPNIVYSYKIAPFNSTHRNAAFPFWNFFNTVSFAKKFTTECRFKNCFPRSSVICVLFGCIHLLRRHVPRISEIHCVVRCFCLICVTVYNRMIYRCLTGRSRDCICIRIVVRVCNLEISLLLYSRRTSMPRPQNIRLCRLQSAYEFQIVRSFSALSVWRGRV